MLSSQALVAAETLLASAARTASVNSSDFSTAGARGVMVFIDVTAVTATPSLVFTIQAKDPASGKYVDLLSSAAITATGTTMLVVHPDATAAANAVAALPISRTLRVKVVAADSDSATYSVGCSLTE